MLFVALGDATDVRTWSGMPYFLSAAGIQAGFFEKAARLPYDSQRRQRVVWNLLRLLRHGERGGYQFSIECAERLFRAARLFRPHGEVLSQFPMFPPDSWLDTCDISYYVVASLKQIFVVYGISATVGGRMRAEVVARERDRYERAQRIICMSRWAAESMLNDYGIAASKVFIVPAAANMSEADVPPAGELPEMDRSPLRLGFIGKQVERKNLALLLRVAELLDRRGVPVEVAAVGFAPDSVAPHRLLRPLGFIDKRTNMRDFVSFVRSCHFGCLFSHAEAFGIANMEFIRLGVPALTWDVGGLADTVPKGLGHVFAAEAQADEIAEKLHEYARDEAAYHRLRRIVQARSGEVTYERVVARLRKVWAGEKQDCLTTVRAC